MQELDARARYGGARAGARTAPAPAEAGRAVRALGTAWRVHGRGRHRREPAYDEYVEGWEHECLAWAFPQAPPAYVRSYSISAGPYFKIRPREVSEPGRAL